MTAVDTLTPMQQYLADSIEKEKIARAPEQAALDARIDTALAEKLERGEPITPVKPSAKVWRWVRFDENNPEHLRDKVCKWEELNANGEWVRMLQPHATRFHESEEHGKLFAEYLDRDKADHLFKRGQLQAKRGYVAFGAPPPDDLQLLSSVDDILANKLKFVFDAAKKDLRTTPPRLVIAKAMETLRQMQTLDDGFPKPLTSKALHGLLGEFVEIAHPATEGCKEMLLYQMLPLIGVLLGDSYYLLFGADKHLASIFSLVIARTSEGKGQAKRAAEEAIAAIDPTFKTHSNVSSGEGLIRMLGNSIAMPGGHKKRVAIHCSEMVNLFVAQSRKDSTLGGFTRAAFDGELIENYRSESKKSQTADNYILGLVGTITPKELEECMPKLDWSNGAQNRFLWSVGYKSHSLEISTSKLNWGPWATRVRKLLDLNLSTNPTPVEYSEEGKRVFTEWSKSIPPHDDTPQADSRARAKALCVRVAILYAMLDERRLEGWQVQLEPQHIEAAIEIIQHSWQSVEWFLARNSNQQSKVSASDTQKLLAALIKKVREGGEENLTATEVYQLFPNITIEQRDAICVAAGATPGRKTTRGKPVMVWTLRA